jgi:hypothetical protein
MPQAICPHIKTRELGKKVFSFMLNFFQFLFQLTFDIRGWTEGGLGSVR